MLLKTVSIFRKVGLVGQSDEHVMHKNPYNELLNIPKKLTWGIN
jgi:hypothetical protein